MAEDLFSAGFAWDDVADDATPVATHEGRYPAASARAVSQTAATPIATPEARSFSGDFGWFDGPVASVASVADDHDGVGMSQFGDPPPATPVATHETADFLGVRKEMAPPVADVASVANWTAAIDRAARRGCPPAMADAAWRGLLMDARMTVQNWGSDLITLGWSTLDVFGGPLQPQHRRIDVAGLVVMLRGRPVEAIDRDTALIRATPRDTLTFHRALIGVGGIPFWDWVEINPADSGAVGLVGMGKRLQRVPMSPRQVNPDYGDA